ncbi:hypothetical protein BUALT_Bualt14G0099400 [Buddleja alternifolia]|uniref:Early light-induced protein n=1 Tax=Buddleja alternifolia TaxID=168488 RepID=A0AAV6WTE8_9LAMI|nr:hypothetical protein BUALT_Bualt14G0099400 [Buddleja alternifolia]
MAASCYGMAAVSCGSSVTVRGFGVSNQFFVPSSLKRNVNFRGPAPPKPNPPPKPKVKTGFSDVLAFSGPAPERINGRLAMIGFVTAMGVELANGQDIFSQVQNGGVAWFLGTTVLLSLASLIPMFKGVTVESKSGDLMTSDAELWNGRFAMLGLVALAFTEYLKGSALV